MNGPSDGERATPDGEPGPGSEPAGAAARWSPGPGTFWLILLATFAVKALFVLVLADIFYYGEELEKGGAAKALIDGIPLAWHQLPYHAYEGGGYVASHLKAVAFLLVGENILAHKLMGILWCLLISAAGMVLARRHFGPWAGAGFGLLFLFGPASFQKLSVLHLGIHLEATLFLLLVFDRALSLLSRRRSPDAARDLRDSFWMGLAGGFGLYFNYQTAIVLAWVFSVLAAVRPRLLLSSRGLAGLGGFALGALPLGYMALQVGGEVLDIHGSTIGAQSKALGTQLGAFLRSLYTDAGPLSSATAVFFPLALGAAIVAGLRESDRTSIAFVCGFLVFWGILYLGSGFGVGSVYHYFLLMRLAPAWIVATLVLAAWCRDGHGRIVVAVLCGLGLANSAQIVAKARPGEIGRNWSALTGTRGYYYAGYFAKLLTDYEGSERDRLAPLLEFDEDARTLLLGDLASAGWEHSRDREGLPRLLEQLDPDGRVEFARGLGGWVWARAGGRFERIAPALATCPPELKEALLEGAGRHSYVRFVGDVALELEELVTANPPAAYLRGVGYRVYRRFVTHSESGSRFALRPDLAREWLAERPEPLRAALLEGFDAAHALHTL